MTYRKLQIRDSMLGDPDTAMASWDRDGRPSPLPWPDRPDVGEGPLDRLTLAAVGEVEGDGQLIHQVGRRVRERPALAPDLRVVAVMDPGMADVHPKPVGDDDRGVGVVGHRYSSSRCLARGRLAPPGWGPIGPRNPRRRHTWSARGPAAPRGWPSNGAHPMPGLPTRPGTASAPARV